ncbi:MAG: ATP-binding cassette domain-containing protein [Planctomycetes bacterium]|nr:ATP-binding cassette domain-containing protein [Planctomycetota bacterium]
MIEVRDLSKTFTVHKKAPGLLGSLRSLVAREKVEKEAVRAARFDIAEGEIVGLIGANGAGKTTLVKMLAGIIHPTSGDARVLGHRPWERHNDFRRHIALIMGQKAQLWWDLPAGDCFLLLREIYRIDADRYTERLRYLTRVLDVEEQVHVQIRRLSLGERMKMELIAALLHSPRVVYLDEPTIGLDLTAQRAIRDFLLAYREEHRPAMILTSHYMEDIERLCERIIILREGRVIYDGQLRDVVSTFATHKSVVAHLRGVEGEIHRHEAVSAIAEFESIDPTEVRLRVPRDRVAEASSALLAHYPVADLAIEEPDIGTIIEGIIRRRGGDDSSAEPEATR